MKLTTYLSKFFTVEVNEEEQDGQKVETLWLYEKHNDAEPVMILKPTAAPERWKVGDVYSALPHDSIYSEADLKALAKANRILKQQ